MSSLQKKETLLIVDDSKFQRVVIRQSLGEHFNFAEAVSGEECLTIMEKESDAIDLVLLDIVDQADIEQAVEICRGFRRDAQEVKILFLVRPEQALMRKVAVNTKNAGLIDDFVFYDSSLSYLLAKLEAL